MSEPVDLELVKLQLRVDGAADDDLIASYIVAARTFLEGQTGLVLVSDDARVETFDRFTPSLRLAAWPVREMVSIQYVDQSGDDQDLATDAYRFTMTKRPARISPAARTCWPLTLCGPDAIVVTLKAGFAAPDDVPDDLKVAMLMLIRHWYDNPSAVAAGERAAAIEVPLGVTQIIERYRMAKA